MANIHFFLDFFKHVATSKTRHGTHSPFVYDFVDKVIYDYASKSYTESIESLRKDLYRDPRVLTITDLGAGSMLNNRKQKLVKEIARNALKPKRIAQLLARIAASLKPETIIELGTCLGVTTLYFAKAVPEARIITVEGCPETALVAQENFHRLGVDNIELRTGSFDLLLPEIVQEQARIDFLFIDGNHRREATLNYFYSCLDKTHEGSVFIFDDIYWSAGMKAAWQEIKNHPRVGVTIDLFYIGLVFFKKVQEKENFKIRFI